MLETAVGAISAPTRFSLVRISVRDLVADGKSLVRNSGVGGGGQNRGENRHSPPPQNPPLKRGILWTWGFFLQKERIFPGVHKIGAAISGPRIADTNFTDTRIFLNLGKFGNRLCTTHHNGDRPKNRKRGLHGGGVGGGVGGIVLATTPSVYINLAQDKQHDETPIHFTCGRPYLLRSEVHKIEAYFWGSVMKHFSERKRGLDG